MNHQKLWNVGGHDNFSVMRDEGMSFLVHLGQSFEEDRVCREQFGLQEAIKGFS